VLFEEQGDEEKEMRGALIMREATCSQLHRRR